MEKEILIELRGYLDDFRDGEEFPEKLINTVEILIEKKLLTEKEASIIEEIFDDKDVINEINKIVVRKCKWCHKEFIGKELLKHQKSCNLNDGGKSDINYEMIEEKYL